ncbi:MAG: hypothetical protein ABI541_02080 [Betaproteobacteria bacterium]
MLILVVSFAGLMASGSASAGIGRAVSATCSGGGQLCNNIATFAINVSAGGDFGEGRFTPGPLTCSNLRIHFLVDGTEVAVTGFVGPGAFTAFVSLGFIGPGKHVVGVQAEGEVGGCNVGNLVSWAGKVRLRPV